MARIIWAEPTLSVLNEIAEYIALENIAAKGLVKKVFVKVERLKVFPESGRAPPELKESHAEKLLLTIRIFYRIDKNKIYILYIIRGKGIAENI